VRSGDEGRAFGARAGRTEPRAERTRWDVDAALARVANLERERRVADALLQIDSLDLHTVLDRICRLAVDQMPCDRATAYLFSSRSRGFVPAADCGTPPHVVERFSKKLFFGHSRAGDGRSRIPFIDELRAGRIGYATREDASPEYAELLDTLEQWAIFLVPLRSSARGALVVSVGEPPGFDETARRIVQSLAWQAANLVDQARAFQRLQHAARVRAGLAALAAAVNRETDPERIARLVSEEAATLFRVNVGAVLVAQRDGVAVLGAHGLAADCSALTWKEEPPLLGAVLREGRAIYRNELHEGDAATGPLRRVLGLASALLLPLVGRDGTLGCLLLGDTGRRHAFSDEIADEAGVLAPMASAALERAALFEQVGRREEHFRSLIENASDLITIVGPDLHVRYQSPSIERILGYRPAELVDGPTGQIVHPEEVVAYGRGLAEILAGAESGRREVRVRHRDGSWRVLEGIGTRMTDIDGEPVVVLNSRDVTDRKRTEAREAGQKRVLEAIARGAALPDALATLVDALDSDLGTASAFVVLGADGSSVEQAIAPRLPADAARALYAEGREIAGIAAEAAAAKSRRVTTWDDAGLGGCWAEPVATAGGDVIGVLALHYPASRPLAIEDGPLIEAAAHLGGIAIERERAERELAKARDAALMAARLKSEFLANMSHEIRTPMNGVIGMADLLADSALADDQRDFVATIRASADALLTVINDILDFSKIEAGKMTIEQVPFDLARLLEEVAELLAPRAFKKGLEVVCALPAGLPEHVVGDPHRLRQVLNNLVGNAVKFTERGRVTIAAEILSETAGSARLRLVVRDTGIGIPAERQAAVFDSFTQVDGATTRRYGGTGLGLTITRQLVELMGGRIGVDSAPGRGSAFWVDIELAKPRAAGPATGASAALRGLRVLVADDDEAARSALCELVASFGCAATGVASGAAAVVALREAAASEPFELLLLDAEMPGGSTAALAAVRSDPALAGLAIALLSPLGAPAPDDRDAVAAVLTKPVRRSALRGALASAAGKAIHAAVPPASDDAEVELGLHVLVAEDNAVNRKVAVAMLARMGCRADCVANGAEAVRATSRTRYDAVLMDVQMPEMDGLEATARIRAQEDAHGARLPIVAMTAHAMEGDRERCLQAGMDGYVSKPIKKAEIVRALAALCSASARRDADDAAGAACGRVLAEKRALQAQASGAASATRAPAPFPRQSLRGARGSAAS